MIGVQSGFCRETRLQRVPTESRRGGKIIAGGASPRIRDCIKRAPAGAKDLCPQAFLSPFRGWALVSGPTPGLRPGLLSLRPSGAGLKTGANFATETNYGRRLALVHFVVLLAEASTLDQVIFAGLKF